MEDESSGRLSEIPTAPFELGVTSKQPRGIESGFDRMSLISRGTRGASRMAEQDAGANVPAIVPKPITHRHMIPTVGWMCSLPGPTATAMIKTIVLEMGPKGCLR